jgi:hypothetical protein
MKRGNKKEKMEKRKNNSFCLLPHDDFCWQKLAKTEKLFAKIWDFTQQFPKNDKSS